MYSILVNNLFKLSGLSVQELFAGMFVLLTQLVMILKMEFFYKNVSKIQQLIRRLNGKLYQSRNAEEDM